MAGYAEGARSARRSATRVRCWHRCFCALYPAALTLQRVSRGDFFEGCWMLRLRTLGGLSIENAASIGDVTAHRRPLALLALLAVEGRRGLSRDKIVAFLWPESDAEHGRNSLSQVLSLLRRELAADDIVMGTAELRVNPDVLAHDVIEFEERIAADDLEAAIGLYTGPFLDGVFLKNAPEFEHWVDQERSRLQRVHGDALERLATRATAGGDHMSAVRFWRQRASLVPSDSRAALKLMESLVASGDPASALEHYRVHHALLRDELGLAPDATIAEFAVAIRCRNGRSSDAPSAASPRIVTSSESGDVASAQALLNPPVVGERSEREPNEASSEPWAERGTPEVALERSRRVPLLRPIAAGAVLSVSVVAVLIIVAGLVWRRNGPASIAESSLVRRSDIVLPDSAPLASVRDAPFGRRRKLAISPDGRRLVYVAERGATTQLYLRELDRLDATPIAGTEGAYLPFFSPDGEWIAFFSGRELRKVTATGGPAITLAEVRVPRSGVWTQDGRILVAENGGDRLSWIPSTGGATVLNARQLSVRVLDMELVSADKWILHSSTDGILFLSSLERGQSYAVTLDGVASQDSLDRSRLLYGSSPRYLECGHITYFSGDGVLMALPFDLARRRALGPPAAVHQGTRLEDIGGAAQLTISRNGTLVYAPGLGARRSAIVWFDYVTGRVDTLPFPQAGYRTLKLSPDGRRILTEVDAPPGGPEWRVLDIDRGSQMAVPTGLNPGVGLAHYWWPDGASIVFGEYTSRRAGPPRGVRQSLVNPADRVTMARVGVPSPDGRHLALLMLAAGAITHNPNATSQPDSGRGLWLASIDGSEPDVQLAAGPIAFASFSPDGAWISYSDRSAGQSEVFVTRVAKPGERTKISAQAGDEARWTADGRAITYREGQQWFAVNVSTKKGFVADRPRLLFRGPFQQHAGWSYDVSSDGRRLLLMLGPQDETTNQLVVVTNWFAEVKRLAPPRKK